MMQDYKVKSMELKNARILITGGAGFIGSNLCENLLKVGAIVVCLDNLSTGKYENIATFISNPNFKFIKGDIRNLEQCIEASYGCKYILHQAALGSVPRSIKDPITTNEVNINGFLNMLIAAKQNNIKRFVYAASSSAYGDSEELPKIEKSIGNPLSPYAITKYVNELYANIFSKLYNIETIGLRYFNVFGPKQDPKGEYVAVIPKFISRLIKNESPIINGDGQSTRDFTYIDNVVQMVFLSLITENKDALNEVYNTACGKNISIIKLFETIQSELSKFDNNISSIKPIFGPFRVGDIAHSLASIQKAHNLLGYNPLIDVNEGVKISINWYWDNYKDLI